MVRFARRRHDHEYDLVVIGAGSAGLTAARFGARLGARVALLERDRVGGDCTWTGCVPSKTIVKAAGVAHQARHADRLGLSAREVAVNLQSVMTHVRAVIQGVYADETPEALEGEGIDVLVGHCRFLSPRVLAVGERTVTGRKVIIATGARPRLSLAAGSARDLRDRETRADSPDRSDPPRVFTYQTVWELGHLPERLAVVGGGPLGCEMAQVFARLGSGVTLIGRADRLLPRDEPEASAVLHDIFAEEGIALRLGARVEEIRPRNGRVGVVVNGERMVVDAILLAVGREPNVDGLDLEKANVHFSEAGIVVDERMQTSQPGIYAVGDCTGGYQFTHLAGWQAYVAARNALLSGRVSAAAKALPWVTFTDPEVAHVGLTEEGARTRYGPKARVLVRPMTKVDRARAEVDTSGFLKVIYLSNGAVLGATMVAGRAGEAIHEWALAIDQGLKMGDLATTIHAYPTYSLANMELAADAQIERVLSGVAGAVLKRLMR